MSKHLYIMFLNIFLNVMSVLVIGLVPIYEVDYYQDAGQRGEGCYKYIPI